jgi:hypothetical protein
VEGDQKQKNKKKKQAKKLLHLSGLNKELEQEATLSKKYFIHIPQKIKPTSRERS